MLRAKTGEELGGMGESRRAVSSHTESFSTTREPRLSTAAAQPLAAARCTFEHSDGECPAGKGNARGR